MSSGWPIKFYFRTQKFSRWAIYSFSRACYLSYLRGWISFLLFILVRKPLLRVGRDGKKAACGQRPNEAVTGQSVCLCRESPIEPLWMFRFPADITIWSLATEPRTSPQT